MIIQQSQYSLFAPLPVPFFERLVQRFQKREKNQKLSEEEFLDRFYKELQRVRDIACVYMHPFVQSYLNGGAKGSVNSLSRVWFQQALEQNSPGKKSVSEYNLEYWKGKGLLRSREHGIPEPSNAAAFFTYWIMEEDHRKGFLPSSMSPSEPDWWCWQQASPDQAPIPCPIPLPKSLPPKTVLWTPWAGASWDEAWLLIGGHRGARGAIRFAGTYRSRMDEGSFRWQIQPDEPLCWDPKLVGVLEDLPDERNDPIERQELLHLYATATLRHLAQSRVLPPSPW